MEQEQCDHSGITINNIDPNGRMTSLHLAVPVPGGVHRQANYVLLTCLAQHFFPNSAHMY